MRSKGNAPDAEQKRYWSEIAELGCVICGQPPEIDHLAGSSARSNKIKIGNWWVCCLCPEHHRLGEANRTTRETAFMAAYFPEVGTLMQLRKKLFYVQINKYEAVYHKPAPIPDNALIEIINYRY